MKKAKRILSLVLAVMLVMSVFVLPASAAAPEDEVEPCYVVDFCPRCGGSCQRTRVEAPFEYAQKSVESCASHNEWHPHYIMAYYDRIDCPNCGSFRSIRSTYEVCGF